MFGAADEQEANIVLLHGGEFALQVFAQKAHQKFHFGLRAAPVFQRKGVQGEARDMQARASLDDDARGLHSGAVAGNARQMAALRPAAVAIHDDGEVLRQALGIEFLEKFRFFAVRVLQKFCLVFTGNGSKDREASRIRRCPVKKKKPNSECAERQDRRRIHTRHFHPHSNSGAIRRGMHAEPG